MSNEHFFHIWNQLVLCTQYDIYGDPKPIIESLQKQIVKAKDENAITNRQYLILINCMYEWGDIFEQSRKKDA